MQNVIKQYHQEVIEVKLEKKAELSMIVDSSAKNVMEVPHILNWVQNEMAPQVFNKLISDTRFFSFFKVFLVSLLHDYPTLELEVSPKKDISKVKRQFVALMGREQVAATSLRELAQELKTRGIDPRSVKLTTIPEDKRPIHFGFRTRRRKKRDADSR